MKSERGIKTSGDGCIRLGKGGFKLLFFPKPAIPSKVPASDQDPCTQRPLPGPGHGSTEETPTCQHQGQTLRDRERAVWVLLFSHLLPRRCAKWVSMNTYSKEERKGQRAMGKPRFPSYYSMTEEKGYGPRCSLGEQRPVNLSTPNPVP